MRSDEGLDKYEVLIELARRRGFFWPSFEIYGGVSGFYDLGPMGSLLKENIRRLWIEYFVIQHAENVVLVETPMITPEVVFKASGHLEAFTDPVVMCSRCGRVFRADKLIEEVTGEKAEGLPPEELSRIIREKGIKCPICGGDLGEVRLYNLLFQTYIGPYRKDIGYLRPEAAQGMFTSFKRVYSVSRSRLPLGIAQVGRVARNEISPRQGMIRLREFTIMEMEFFYDPGGSESPDFDRFSNKRLRILTAEQRRRGEERPLEIKADEAVDEGIIKNSWLAYWMLVSKEFIKKLGVSEGETYFEDKLPEERAHYATQTFDQLVKVSRWGWIEVSGHAYRGDYDLSRHAKFSGQDLTVYRPLKEPISRKVRKYSINKELIGKLFRGKAPEVIKELQEIPLERLEDLLKSPSKEVVIKGFSIPKDAIRVKVVEEVVKGKRIIPHVVEPSFGAERLVFTALDKALMIEDGRIYLKLPPNLAPIKVAVLPLLSKEPFKGKAKAIFRELVNAGIHSQYDDSGSIGRRYARADEVGIPYAITVDHETFEDDTVTIRFRDTKKQIRIESRRVKDWVKERLS